MLTVRDRGEGWIWEGYVTPEIRLLTGNLGETTPGAVDAYTADKIKVTFKVTLPTLPNQDSQLAVTIDRNTGAAEFQYTGPAHPLPGGSSWRQVVETDRGQCERQKPAL